MKIQFLAVLLLGPAAARAEPARLTAIEVEEARVVLRLSRPAAFRIKAEAEPPSVTITLSDTELADGGKDLSNPKGMARLVSSALAVEDGVPAARITIRLDSKREYEPVLSGADLALELKGPPPVPEEPAPKPAAPTAASAARKRSFHVQLASLPSEKSAAGLKAKLEAELSPLEVRKVEVNGKTVYRVLMGPYPDRPAAAAALEKAAKQGQTGLITKD